MRRFALTLMIGVSTLVLYACEGSLIDADPVPELSIAGEQTASSGGFLFPAGTSVSLQTDEVGTKRIHFELPEDYYMIGRVDASFPELGGEVLKAESGDITCRCTEGSGDCMPFRAGGGGQEVWGCIFGDGCNECLGTRSRLMLVGDDWVRVPFEETALVDLSAPRIKTVVTKEEAAGLRCASSVLFEDPEVRDHLIQFMGKYQSRNVAQLRAAGSRAELPESYQMVPFDVYGNLVWLPVLRGSSVSAFMSELVREAARTPGGGGSCNCSEGGGSCIHESQSVPFIGYAEWCESDGCSACTLHG